MPVCSAIGCKNRSTRKAPGVTFHRFPKESVLRASWIVACRRKDWLPTKYSVLCSEHFSEDLMDRTALKTVRLRENAIPSIFNFPSDHQKISKGLSVKKEPLNFMPTTTPRVLHPPNILVFNNEDTRSCEESMSETTKECGVMEAGLVSVENESSTEYVVPVTITEKCESTEKPKRPAFKAALSFIQEISVEPPEDPIPSSESPPENRAIDYVDRVKDDHSETKPRTEEEVYAQIAKLFENEEDLIKEFSQFLSDSNGSDDVTFDVSVPEKCNSPKSGLHSTARKSFTNNQKNQPSNKSHSEPPVPCFVIATPRLYSPVYISSAENTPPSQIPGMCRLKKKGFRSIAPKVSCNNQKILSRDGSTSKDPVVIQATACSNTPIKEPMVESIPLSQIPGICNPPNISHSTASGNFFSKVKILSNDRSTSTAPVVIQTTACSKSPVKAEKRPPFQTSKFKLASTSGATSSDNEAIESADEGLLETIKTEQDVDEPPTACLNSKDSNDEEDYPYDDIEKKQLRRKLEDANKLIIHYRKKMKVLQQQNRRWKRQLEKARHNISVLKKNTKKPVCSPNVKPERQVIKVYPKNPQQNIISCYENCV